MGDNLTVSLIAFMLILIVYLIVVGAWTAMVIFIAWLSGFTLPWGQAIAIAMVMTLLSGWVHRSIKS